jgi:hypothetical protein
MLRTYEPYVSSVDVDVRLRATVQESWRERRSILVLSCAHSGYRQFHDSWWHVSVPGQNLDLPDVAIMKRMLTSPRSYGTAMSIKTSSSMSVPFSCADNSNTVV